MGIYATSLTPRMERAIELREQKGMSYAQMASIMGCKRQIARNLYQRAIERRKRLTAQNRPRSVDVNPIMAHMDGRVARLMGYECDAGMPPEWQQGWVVADRAVQMGVLR